MSSHRYQTSAPSTLKGQLPTHRRAPATYARRPAAEPFTTTAAVVDDVAVTSYTTSLPLWVPLLPSIPLSSPETPSIERDENGGEVCNTYMRPELWLLAVWPREYPKAPEVYPVMFQTESTVLGPILSSLFVSCGGPD